MKNRISVVLAGLIGLLSLCSCNTEARKAVRAAEGLAARILPEQHANIDFRYVGDEKENYSLAFEGDRLIVSGSNATAMAVGLNRYLKEICHLTVTWYADDQLTEPETLPAFEGKLTGEARTDYRFFLNYCTSGYSLNWWQWRDWEHLIDWMALNGVNMALATTGQESVWQKVWEKFGLNDEQIRSYFTGPSYLAWHRMANIDSWSGPLPQVWLDGQKELQQQIVKRERELGIQPILASFTGHVPEVLKEIYPDAKITKLSAWGGFPEENHCWYLDPTDPLFQQIQTAFLQEQEKLYGECKIYGIDPYNELDPPSWDPEFLARASRLTYESIRNYDKDAKWLQMAWVFWHKRKMWTPERLEAYLTAVPQGKMIMLDYYCDKIELHRNTENFYGNDFIWSYLGNFGGNTMIAGNLKDVSMKLDRAFAEAGEQFKGVGCTLEGLDVNPFMYEYVLDRAWEKHCTDEEWMNTLADRHLGKEDEHFRKAWSILYNEVYKVPSGNKASLIGARPSLSGRSRWCFSTIGYENSNLLGAWKEITLTAPSDEPSFNFDCANVARQCLENHFGQTVVKLIGDYKAGKKEALAAHGNLLLELLDDIDLITSTDPYFLLGRWLENAKLLGNTPEEKAYFEQDARNIITTWGYKGIKLNDYANRAFSGLVKDFYKPRWAEFISCLEASLEERTAFDEEAFNTRMYDREWDWVLENKLYPTEISSPAFGVSCALYEKWADRILQNK